MKVVTAAEMQEIDRITIHEYGVPAEVLMSLAGKAVFDHIVCRYRDLGRAAVISGTGNNGGDGFVVAHFLHNSGCRVEIFLTGGRAKVTRTSSVYLKLCEKDGVPVREISESDMPGLDLGGFDVIVDAILGTGFNDTPRGIPATAIEAINSSGTDVVSIDLPSGLPSDGVPPQGPAVRASSTVTIGLPKVSLVTYPGIEYTGELVVADIGFPRDLIHTDALAAELADEDYCSRWSRMQIGRDANKSQRGHLLLIGGFPGMEGAVIMAARAALRTGIGYISLLTTDESRRVIAGKVPEMMTLGVDAVSLGKDRLTAVEEVRRVTAGRRYDAVVMGPGLGRDAAALNLFNAVIDTMEETGISRVLIDGDGLFHLAGFLEKKTLPDKCGFVLTPHLMEAARILRRQLREVEALRLESARECSLKARAVTLLKGPATIITDGKSIVINGTGNPCLATAGTGDVLSGIIGALLLRDLPALHAAGLGAYLHGRAADAYVKENRRDTMRATDLLDYL